MVQQTTHPSRETLNAFSLGQLPPEAAASIEDHISDCQPCCETMLGLSDDDTFVGLLQDAGQNSVDESPADRKVNQKGFLNKPSSAVTEIPAILAEHPRYEIVGLIGKGGMGDVYEARHRMMNRTVALKVIRPELVRKPEAVRRFHREVKTAAQLSHPNIVTSHDAEQAGDVHFLVMEYVDGVDLSQVIKERGGLPIAEACDYVRQAAIGLQNAHECGMVHRDIKPHNLMVTTEGTVKILDFGLASLAPEAVSDGEAVEARGDLTVAGAIMGTPDFISPEQADDARQADIRSDIYSLGSTLYFLLSGQPPFADGSVMHKLKSHAQSQPEPLESLRDDVPPELVAVVTKMTAKDPGERYLTPSEVADALESFLRTWQRDEAESLGHVPSHGGFGSGSDRQKPDTGDAGREWLPVAAKWLFYLACMSIAILMWELFFMDFTSEAADIRFYFYIGAAICLSTIAGALSAAHRFQSNVRQFEQGDRRAFRLKTDEALIIAGILVATIFAAVHYFQTNHGVVRIEVNDPSLQVTINDETITMKDGDEKSLTIRPGEQTLTVRKDDADFEFETDRFQIRRGDKIAFKVDYFNGEIVVRKDYEPFHRAHLLVGQWRGKHDADQELRLTFNLNGTFEKVVVDPAQPQQIHNRTVGKYTADFSVFPAKLDLDGTTTYPAFDPELEQEPESDDSAAGVATGPERETVKKHKLEASIEMIDANTLHISDLEADSRPKTFGEDALVLHRQGATAEGEVRQDGVRFNSKALSDDVKVQQILDRMVKAYAECKSYRDSGVIKTVIVENSDSPRITFEHSFATAFERPDRFRLEIRDEDDGKVLISANGQIVRTWWDVEPGIQEPESLDHAMAQAIGFSGAGVGRIPAMLMPQRLDGGVDLDLIDPKQIEDGKLQNDECFRLEYNFRDEQIILWIDKQSYLVRQIDERIKADGKHIERMTTCDPTIDGKITGKMLEFLPEGDLKQLQGEWELLKVQEGDRRKSVPPDNALVTVKGNRLLSHSGSLRIEIDGKQAPKTIDFYDQKGGLRLRGIYKFSDDRLIMILHEDSKLDAENPAYPTSFDPPADNDTILWELRKATRKVSDREKIQGNWQVVHYADNGRVEPLPFALKMKLAFTDNLLTFTMEEGKEEVSSIKLDESTKPKSIDLTNGDQAIKGIYELRDDQLRICLTQSRKGARAVAFESKPDTTNNILIVAKRPRSSPVSPDIAAVLARTGQSEEEFKKKLHTAISHAAGIPNAQWEKFATDPRASTEGIEGEPLSLLLLGLNPPKASKDNPDVLPDFRLLTYGAPKPTELHKAMAPSQLHGYVSVIQPEYIKDTDIGIDPETGLLRGSVEFEAPERYAGKVHFVMEVEQGRIQIVEFALPNHRVTIVRDKVGSWRRRAAPPN